LAPSVALIAKTDVICVATQPTFEREMKRRRIHELKIHESLPDMEVYVVQRRERPLTSAASRLVHSARAAGPGSGYRVGLHEARPDQIQIFSTRPRAARRLHSM
jgi:hypothetical protein